jgi:hypothetical protein
VNLPDWIGVLVGVLSVFFALLAWLSSQRSVRISEEQLEIAREEAEREPELEATVKFRPSKSMFSKRNELVVEVANTGRAAAHGLHGWIDLGAEMLKPVEVLPSGPDVFEWDMSPSRYEPVPEKGFYKTEIWNNGNLMPGAQIAISLRVEVLAWGETAVRCRFVTSEGAELEEEFRLQVSSSSSENRP